MKSYKELLEAFSTLEKETNQDPLVILSDAKGMIAHALLSTLEGIHEFLLQSPDIKRLMMGGAVKVKTRNGKKYVVTLSNHSEFSKK